MLRPSPNHGTQRLPNDDDDDLCICIMSCSHMATLPGYGHSMRIIYTHKVDLFKFVLPNTFMQISSNL